ncbi:hypothetical protein EDD90_7800 [Streptomyces sp. Ag109_O5-1]|nr:hypothetical protein EDD90_7800 [Streptomyces sp. Ag109_O5-1]
MASPAHVRRVGQAAPAAGRHRRRPPRRRHTSSRRDARLPRHPGRSGTPSTGVPGGSFDWRLRVRLRLAALVPPQRVAEELERRRSSAPERADAQVVFLCHSMGGLVARYYVECPGDHEVTRRQIALAAFLNNLANRQGETGDPTSALTTINAAGSAARPGHRTTHHRNRGRRPFRAPAPRPCGRNPHRLRVHRGPRRPERTDTGPTGHSGRRTPQFLRAPRTPAPPGRVHRHRPPGHVGGPRRRPYDATPWPTTPTAMLCALPTERSGFFRSRQERPLPRGLTVSRVGGVRYSAPTRCRAARWPERSASAPPGRRCGALRIPSAREACKSRLTCAKAPPCTSPERQSGLIV